MGKPAGCLVLSIRGCRRACHDDVVALYAAEHKYVHVAQGQGGGPTLHEGIYSGDYSQ